MTQKSFPIHHPFRHIADTWATIAPEPALEEKKKLKARAKELLIKTNTALVAHYYVSADLQDLAEETGGFVGDSLEMAKFGREHFAKNIIVAGVRFMGETAKILNPEKQIIMPNLKAECSLDLGCPAEDFYAFCDQHPDCVVVVYANTSAEVKARADWVITSSMAVELINDLHHNGQKILWAPDKHLGHYVQSVTGADMIIWEGACIVHEEFRATALAAMKIGHPDAVVLAHPESPADVCKLADVVGSTSQILKAVRESGAKRFIIATDFGMKHQLEKQNNILAERNSANKKEFFVAPTQGEGATCKSCAFCPWMAMNDLPSLIDALENPDAHQIDVPEALIKPASVALTRMVNFTRQYSKNTPVTHSGPA